MDWGWPGALFTFSKTFNGIPFFLQMFLDFRNKALMEPFSEHTAVNHALGLCCQKTGINLLFLFLKAEDSSHGKLRRA